MVGAERVGSSGLLPRVGFMVGAVETHAGCIGPSLGVPRFARGSASSG